MYCVHNYIYIYRYICLMHAHLQVRDSFREQWQKKEKLCCHTAQSLGSLLPSSQADDAGLSDMVMSRKVMKCLTCNAVV